MSIKHPQLRGHNIVQILKFSFRQYVLCHQTILFFKRFHTDRSWAFKIHFLRFRGIRFRIHLYFNVAASSSHNTVSTSPHEISVYLYLAPNRKQNTVTEHSCILKESISGSNISLGTRTFLCFFGRFHQSLCQKESLLLFLGSVAKQYWPRKSGHLPTLHGSPILLMC